MCGPLALALPVHHLQRSQQITASLLYNTGRVITYTAMGALFGWAGRRLYIAGIQQWFSIAMGLVILLLAFATYFLNKPISPAWMRTFHYRLLTWMNGLLQSPGYRQFLLLGMANGLLPCGMVYLAIAAAVSTSGIGESMVLMAAFGAGTLPAMLALSYFGVQIKLSVRQQIKKAMPYVVAAMAVLLILRGMNLGIPFVSPAMAHAPQAVISCH
jgi:sulfite exporter TauE/SafE